jgi:paraquat-inducible protein B
MDSKNKTETLDEQMGAIVNVPVATGIANMQNEYLATAKRLRALPLHIHGSVLSMLQTEFQVRQQEAQNAIEQHKYELAVKQRADQAEKQQALEKEQREAEEANRPRLVPAGGPPVQ